MVTATILSFFLLKKKNTYLASLGLSCVVLGLQSSLQHVGSTSVTRD